MPDSIGRAQIGRDPIHIPKGLLGETLASPQKAITSVFKRDSHDQTSCYPTMGGIKLYCKTSCVIYERLTRIYIECVSQWKRSAKLSQLLASFIDREFLSTLVAPNLAQLVRPYEWRQFKDDDLMHSMPRSSVLLAQRADYIGHNGGNARRRFYCRQLPRQRMSSSPPFPALYNRIRISWRSAPYKCWIIACETGIMAFRQYSLLEGQQTCPCYIQVSYSCCE